MSTNNLTVDQIDETHISNLTGYPYIYIPGKCGAMVRMYCNGQYYYTAGKPRHVFVAGHISTQCIHPSAGYVQTQPFIDPGNPCISCLCHISSELQKLRTRKKVCANTNSRESACH